MFKRLAIALLAILFAANVYRAWTQSLTIDEAFTWQLYLSRNLRAILTNYDASNHVLYTLLARLSTQVFGHSEFAIRLPSVLAGALYFLAIFRLSLWYFGERWLFLLSVAALSLNPFVLDFLSAARGYGLALALYFAGLDQLNRARLTRAGTLLGLAIAANMTLVFPVGATLALRIRRRWEFVDKLAIPAVVTAALIIAVPLSYASVSNFYAGALSFRMMILTLVTPSFRHHMTIMPEAQIVLINYGVPLTLLAAVLVAIAIRRDREALTVAGALAITLVLVAGAHYLAHLPYPERRTGLYFIPLFTLVALLGARNYRWGAAPIIGVVALYVLQFQVSQYEEWTFDSSTKRVAKLLHERDARNIGASWELEPALNYYRLRFGASHMLPIERRSPDGDYDAYVLLPGDHAVASQRRLRVIFRDDLSRVLVAVP